MITVVGSINIDLVATVDRLPRPGETVPGSSFTKAAGGKGANQALAGARAGAPVRLIGAVGADPFADIALANLRAARVDLDSVAVVEEATGTALILVDGGGENTIAVVPGANAMTLPAHVDRLDLSPRDILLLQLEVPIETVAAALAQARAAGALAIINTAPFHQDALPLLTRTDVVVMNETEFDLCADAIDRRHADRVERMKGVRGKTGATVVVTLGVGGAIAIDREGVVRAKALGVEPVDTVGAGDTFCGYLAAGLHARLPLAAALARATAAGSLACAKAGAQPSVPLATEVTAALEATPTP